MGQPHKTPLVHVVWDDAYSTDEWVALPDLSTKRQVCHSVGFLVAKTKDLVVVAGTIEEGGDACCVIHIPRRMVKSIEKVGV